MNEERSTSDINPNADPGENRIRDLEARKKDLLQRKNRVKDSFTSRQIDFLLLEVEDRLAEYTVNGSVQKN